MLDGLSKLVGVGAGGMEIALSVDFEQPRVVADCALGAGPIHVVLESPTSHHVNRTCVHRIVVEDWVSSKFQFRSTLIDVCCRSQNGQPSERDPAQRGVKAQISGDYLKSWMIQRFGLFVVEGIWPGKKAN